MNGAIHPAAIARVGVLSTVLLLVSACGGPSLDPYDRATACQVDTHLITDVVGTDEFEVDERGTWPVSAESVTTARWSCDVNLADKDDVLSVTGKIGSPDDIAARTQFVEAAPEQFDVAGGRAGIKPSGDSFSAQWVCGSTAVYVTAGPTEATTKKERADLVTAYAESADCTP